MPAALAEQASWYEVGVFANGCPPPALLLGGIPQEGTLGRVAFAASSKAPPAFGPLPTETYGIAAVALAANCGVVGTGCATISVSGSGALTVSIAAVTGQPAGACETGSVCEDAQCVPSADAAVADGTAPPSVGEACTLALVGQGPLADPLGVDSTLLSAPAIAATPTGFLIAYREFDPTEGAARLTTIAVDPSGAAAPPTQTALLDVCTGSPQIDATGLAFSGNAGTIAVSRPACLGDGDAGGTLGGLVLVTIDGSGAIQGSSFTTGAGESISLGQAHSIASTTSGILLAYTDPTDQNAFAATITGTDVATSPAPIAFSAFGAKTDTSAYVVGTGYGTALFAITASNGGSASNAVVATGAAGAKLGAGSGASFAANWASASGSGSRVLVASSGPSVSSSIAWSAFDIGTQAASHTGTFAPAGLGSVAFVDVAMAGDHAFFAAQIEQSISLFAFEKASTLPAMLDELDLGSYPAIPIGQLRDGLVAVAATESRIAVVWGTGATLGPDDDVGGYAVFECSP